MQMQVDQKRFLHKTSSHFYVLPHPYLRSAIAHYTIMQEDAYAADTHLQLVPDVSGCIVFKASANKLDIKYWGPTTKLVDVKTESEHIDFSFFIEFHQGGAYQLFQRPLKALLDEKVALADLYPTFYHIMVEAYENCDTLEAFLQTIEVYLISIMHEEIRIVKSLRSRMHPTVSLREVSTAIGYSERHVQRLFHEQMGCSMKHYQRIQRINMATKLLKHTPSIVQVAQLCGYYDQSHFIHDFTRICGCTPKAYKEKMSLFYQEAYKF